MHVVLKKVYINFLIYELYPYAAGFGAICFSTNSKSTYDGFLATFR